MFVFLKFEGIYPQDTAIWTSKVRGWGSFTVHGDPSWQDATTGMVVTASKFLANTETPASRRTESQGPCPTWPTEVRHVLGGYRHLGQPWLGRHWFSEVVGLCTLGEITSDALSMDADPRFGHHDPSIHRRKHEHGRAPTRGAIRLTWGLVRVCCLGHQGGDLAWLQGNWWGALPIMFKQNHIFWPWHTRELGLIPWIVMKKSGFSYQLWVWTCPKSGNTWYLKLWMCECAGLGYEGRIQEWLPPWFDGDWIGIFF